MVWKPNVTVAAIVERDGHFLLVEESSGGRLVLNQPAGHLEEGESLLDAVRRETQEETAWTFHPDALLGIYRWRRSDDVTYLRFAFVGRVDRHDPDQPLDRGIARALWLTAEELRAQHERHRSPQVQRCIDDFLAGRRYPLDLLRDFAPEG